MVIGAGNNFYNELKGEEFSSELLKDNTMYEQSEIIWLITYDYVRKLRNLRETSKNSFFCFTKQL